MPFPFLAPTVVVPQTLNRPFHPFTLPSILGSGSGSGSGSGTPPAANLFSVTFSTASPILAWALHRIF